MAAFIKSKSRRNTTVLSGRVLLLIVQADQENQCFTAVSNIWYPTLWLITQSHKGGTAVLLRFSWIQSQQNNYLFSLTVGEKCFEVCQIEGKFCHTIEKLLCHEDLVSHKQIY